MASNVGRLAAALAPGGQPGLVLRQGVVTAVTTAPNAVTVEVGGASTAIPGCAYLASYAPAVDDTVWLLRAGPLMVVLGTLA